MAVDLDELVRKLPDKLRGDTDFVTLEQLSEAIALARIGQRAKEWVYEVGNRAARLEDTPEDRIAWLVVRKLIDPEEP